MAGDFETGTSKRHFPLHISSKLADLTLSSVLVRNSDPCLAEFRGKSGQLSPKDHSSIPTGGFLPSHLRPTHATTPVYSTLFEVLGVETHRTSSVVDLSLKDSSSGVFKRGSWSERCQYCSYRSVILHSKKSAHFLLSIVLFSGPNQTVTEPKH